MKSRAKLTRLEFWFYYSMPLKKASILPSMQVKETDPYKVVRVVCGLF